MWTSMWSSSSPDWQNALLHNEHLYYLSPVWTLMCFIKCPLWLNDLLHTWRLYGFSPLWILLCATRLADVENCLPQTLHWNGFSLEWLCRSIASSLLLAQHLPHSLHLYLPLYSYACTVWSEMKSVSHTECTCTGFYARQHICYRVYAMAIPSACPTVCLSVTRVDQSKTVEAKITQFSPHSSRA